MSTIDYAHEPVRSPTRIPRSWRTLEEYAFADHTVEYYQEGLRHMRELGHSVYATMGCGHECAIRTHSISAEGVLHPSLRCPVPVDGKECPSHDMPVRLVGWTGGALPATS